MLIAHQTVENDDGHFADNRLASGLIQREYDRCCRETSDANETKPAVVFPILNFFGGAVSPARVRHESAAQLGGLKHWRYNTSKQREENNELSRVGGFGQTNYDRPVAIPANFYNAASQSTGMGLEGENLHAFITTGSFEKIIPIAAATETTTTTVAQPDSIARDTTLPPIPAVKMHLAPTSLNRKTGALYSYRSKASITYTNLPAIAVNQ